MAIKPSKLQTDTPRTDSFSLSAAISRHEDDAEHWRKYASRMLDWARGLERELALANARIDYLCSPDSSSPEESAIEILRELHKHLDFEEPMRPNEMVGVDSPDAINAVFAKAYALLNSTTPQGAKT